MSSGRGSSGDRDTERRPPSGTVVRRLLSRAFDAAGIRELRYAVSRCAATAGLAGDLLDDYVLAVNELVTNAVRHGCGAGLLRLWLDEDRLVCEVTDNGDGITRRDADGRRRPAPHVAGGWGLWLARQLSDSMTVVTGGGGTSVRVTAALPGATAASSD
jgi:serine/threonine-protein kinase RsbW